MSVCHGSGLDAPDPDVPCCWGSVMGRGCDCWAMVLDEQPDRSLRQEGPQPVQPRMCGDCAWRKDSPERAALGGDDPFQHGPDVSFQCHQGMAKAVRWVHPSGAEQEIGTDSYHPDAEGNRSWQTDGTPALVCAGWAAACGLHPRQNQP